MTDLPEVQDDDGGLVILDRHKQAGIAVSAFFLSVIFIACGLLVLVRFWVFTNIFYNIFILSTLIVGIVFNIVSLDMLFSVETVSEALQVTRLMSRFFLVNHTRQNSRLWNSDDNHLEHNWHCATAVLRKLLQHVLGCAFPQIR